MVWLIPEVVRRSEATTPDFVKNVMTVYIVSEDVTMILSSSRASAIG